MQKTGVQWLVIIVLAAMLGSAGNISAEVFEVPIAAQAGFTIPSAGIPVFQWGLLAGDTADGGQRVALFAFDLSFLPDNTVVNRAVVHIPVRELLGSPADFGQPVAGVVPLVHTPTFDPRPEWADTRMPSTEPLQGGMGPGGWMTADLGRLVASHLDGGLGDDPAWIVVRVEFMQRTDNDGAMDAARFGTECWMELDLDLSAAETMRPRHHVARRVIPVAASLTGAAGTRWVTEASLVNRSAHPAAVWLYFTPSGRNGRSEFQVRRVDLAPGEQRTWDDILPQLFYLIGTKGWLEVASTAPDLVVSARVSNVGGDGTYGQIVPQTGEEAVFGTAGRLFVHRNERWLGMLRTDAGNRTNLGLVNLGLDSVVVKVVASTPEGQESGQIEVPPRGHVQQALDLIVPGVADAGPVTLRLYLLAGHVTDPDEAGVIAYASRVDNTTGDAVFLVAR